MDDTRASDKMHELGLLGLLARCSPHVPEELRECIEMAMGSSSHVAKVERRFDRIDFVTHAGMSSFDCSTPDRIDPGGG